MSDPTLVAALIDALPDALAVADDAGSVADDWRGSEYVDRMAAALAPAVVAWAEGLRDEARLRERIGAVVNRWYRLRLLRFNSHDDGSDDLLLRDELVRAALASPEEYVTPPTVTAVINESPSGLGRTTRR